MGLFSKNKKENGYTTNLPKLPTLPELPGHSEFPEIPTPKQTLGELLNLKNDNEDIHKLPSFPSTSLGEKISQDTIKSAVGIPNNDDIYKDYEYDNNESEKMPEMVPEKIRSPDLDSIQHTNQSKIISNTENEENIMPKIKTSEPIFIRIDKFEESLNVFHIVKEKISEIEELLKDTKNIKKREQEELDKWENEILQLKMQIEKVDKDIFSKIE